MPGRNSVDIKTNLDATKAQQQLDAFAQKVAKITGAEYTFKISVAEDKLDKAKTGLIQVSSAIEGVTNKQKESLTALGYYGRAVQEAKNDIDDFRQSLNNIKNDTGVLGLESRSASKSVTQMVRAFGSASKAERDYESQTRATKAEQAGFNQAVLDTSRTLYRAQAIITGFAWNVFVKGIRDAFVELKNVDTELVTIQKVTGQTREQVQALADTSYETAARYGAVASDYLSSVASFARAGYAEQADALGELSLMTQKVGDVSAKTADQFLLSVDAAYQYGGSVKELTKVLDGANEIGNRFATDVDKITTGLGLVANVAKQANVSIEETTAALGTITAVTQRSGSEAGRALRALLLNITADISTEIDEDTGDHWTAEEIEAMSTSLQKFGIYTRYVKDGMEQLRNPMEVIGELAEKVKKNEISEVELNDLLQGLGGKLRSNQLLALINRWDMYESMLETYKNAAGSAEEELDIYLESWEAKIATIKAEWTELVNNTLSSQLISDLLAFASNTLQAANSIWELVGAIGGLVVALNGNRIASLLGNFANGIHQIIGVFTGAGSLAGGIGVVGLVITAVSSLVIAYEKGKKALAEGIEEAYKSVEAQREQTLQAEKLNSEFLALNEAYRLGNATQEEVAESAYKTAEAFGIEKDVIDGLVYALGNYEDALRAAIKAKAEENFNDYYDTENQLRLTDPLRGDSGDYLLSRMGRVVGEGEFAELREYTNTSISEWISAYNQLVQINLDALRSGEELGQEYYDNQKVIDELRETIVSLTLAQIENRKQFYISKVGMIDSQEELDAFVEYLIEVEGATGAYATSLEKAVRNQYDFSDSAEEAVDGADEIAKKAEALSDIYSTLHNRLNGLNDAYADLTAIAESYNETGKLTLEQFKQITDGDLLKYLDYVNGKLVVNKEAFYDTADAAKADAVEQLRLAYVQDMLAYSTGQVDKMSAFAIAGLNSAADTAASSGDRALTAAAKWTALASAINFAEEAAMGSGAHSESYWKRGEDIGALYQNAMKTVMALDFGGGGTSSRKSGGGGGGGSSRSSSAEKNNTYIDILKQMLTDADYQVEAWARDGDREDAIIAMYEKAMDEIQSVIDKYRAEGYDDTSDEIQELTKLWWKYADAVEDVHEDLQKRVKESWDDLEDQVGDMVKGKTDDLDDQIDKLEDDYDKLLDGLESAYDAQVDALENARDTEEEQLELEEKRLAVLKAEQDLLNAQNDRSVRKYNNETGEWEWVADERAVQSAREALDKAQTDLSEYEADLALDATKEALKAEYEANKAALEAERDEQINALKAEQEAFDSEWKAITDAMKEPGRDIAEILSEIATNGTPAMKAQVDNITALLGKLGYDVAVVAGAKYGGDVSADDMNRIRKMLSGDYSGAVFDSGGVAGIKGIMLKDTAEAETVLPPSLTKAIITPERNTMFTRFTDDLARMFGISERYNLGASPVPNSFGTNDSHDMVYQINGIKIGSDEAQKPFFEVMRHIAVYSNMN